MDFSHAGIFRGFSLFFIYLTGSKLPYVDTVVKRAAKLLWRGVGGGGWGGGRSAPLSLLMSIKVDCDF